MATCAITPEKQQCGVYMAEEVPSEGDKTLARLYIRHGEVYVNETVLNKCLFKIRNLIDIRILKDHLLKHQVIGRKQLDEITNHYHSRDDQVDNLLTCVGCAGGKHGYFLLYVSLCESSVRVSHRGHKDAVLALQKKAKEMEVVAPKSILLACHMLQQQKLKHDEESSADIQDSGFESNMDDLIYRCNCGSDCSLHDYLDGSGCQKPTMKGFQYLQLPNDSEEASRLEMTLSKQSKVLAKDFVLNIGIKTFQQLNEFPFVDVKQYAKHMLSAGIYENETSAHHPVTCIAETTTLEQLEDVLMQYYSWFNFALLKDLRQNFLFPEGTDYLLQNYEKKFFQYCRRRCFESPLPLHRRPITVNLTTLVFKVDKIFGDYELIDVQQITEIVADVINSPKHAIYVKSVKDGCVEVSCYILPQFQLRQLSDLQISQLKENDIFSFKMDDKELMPRCRHHLYHNDNPEQPESSSDLDGYDASSEESDCDDTPSIISKEVCMHTTAGYEKFSDTLSERFGSQYIPPTHFHKESSHVEDPRSTLIRTLKGCYTNRAFFQRAAGPAIRKFEFINIALLKKQRVSEDDKVRDKLLKRTFHGQIDDIVKKKVEIEVSKIFSDDSRKLVLEEGAPGVRKTMLALKRCSDWGRGAALKEYDVVLLVQLRQFQELKVTLEDIIQIHFDEAELARSISKELFKQNDTVLLILEGWDELPPRLCKEGSFFFDIVNGNKLPNASVLVTSKPTVTPDLYSYMEERHILGFTPKQIKEYVRTHAKDKAESVLKYLNNFPNLKSLAHIPLTLAIICRLASDNIELLMTLTELYNNHICNLLHQNLKRKLSLLGVGGLSKLPKEEPNVDKSLCKLALQGMEDINFVFMSEDLRKVGLDPSESLDGCAFLSTPVVAATAGHDLYYQFAHLSIQDLEFLAAYQIQQLNGEECVQLLKEYRQDKRLPIVWKFYSGIAKLKEEEFQCSIISETTSVNRDQRFLFHCHFEDHDKGICQKGAQKLRHSLNINSILHENKIGDAGAQAISEGLKHCTSIQTLKLGSNPPWGDELKEVAVVLSENKTVSVIQLASNPRREDGLKELADALSENKTVSAIHLSSCELTPACGEHFAQMLRRNRIFKHIKCIGFDKVCRPIAFASTKNSTLTELFHRACCTDVVNFKQPRKYFGLLNRLADISTRRTNYHQERIIPFTVASVDCQIPDLHEDLTISQINEIMNVYAKLGIDGLYMLTPCSHFEGQHTLLVTHKGRILKFTIKSNGGQFYISTRARFNSLVSLLRYYKSAPIRMLNKPKVFFLYPITVDRSKVNRVKPMTELLKEQKVAEKELNTNHLAPLQPCELLEECLQIPPRTNSTVPVPAIYDSSQRVTFTVSDITRTMSPQQRRTQKSSMPIYDEHNMLKFPDRRKNEFGHGSFNLTQGISYPLPDNETTEASPDWPQKEDSANPHGHSQTESYPCKQAFVVQQQRGEKTQRTPVPHVFSLGSTFISMHLHGCRETSSPRPQANSPPRSRNKFRNNLGSVRQANSPLHLVEVYTPHTQTSSPSPAACVTWSPPSNRMRCFSKSEGLSDGSKATLSKDGCLVMTSGIADGNASFIGKTILLFSEQQCYCCTVKIQPLLEQQGYCCTVKIQPLLEQQGYCCTMVTIAENPTNLNSIKRSVVVISSGNQYNLGTCTVEEVD